MPHITDTERRAQRQRDYAVQIDMLRKQAWDGGCEVVGLRMNDENDLCVVRFALFPRSDDDTHVNIRATATTFPDAFKRAFARLPAAIREVTADAAFRAECADEADPQQIWNDMLADYYEGKADDAWLEARAAS